MPNTLAHVGAQGGLTRIALRDADLKWIYLGCVLPDVPWILQRIARVTVPSIDPYTLRAYAIVQASLFGCLILCAAIAFLSKQFWRTGSILGLNALFHLLLDAAQTKWANGVHFLAPFSWEMANWGLFWPEDPVPYVLTGLGAVYMLWNWQRSVHTALAFGRPGAKRVIGAAILGVAYFVWPVLWLHGPIEANNHYLKTLSVLQNRPGQYVELDRVRYAGTPEGQQVLNVWNSEQIRVERLKLQAPATVSVRGVFVDERRIRVLDHHVHTDWFRDNASYLGLLLIAGLWLQYLRKTCGKWSEG